MATTVELQGFNVLHEDLQTIVEAAVTVAPQIVEAAGLYGTKKAKQYLMRKPNYRTGNLYESVRLTGQQPSPGETGAGEPVIEAVRQGDQIIWSTDMFAEGKLSGQQIENLVSGRLIEYGFFHIYAGKFVGPWPFMRPAGDDAAQMMGRLTEQLSEIVYKTPRLEAPKPNETIQKFRDHLYTVAKALGDLQIVSPGSFGRTRSILYTSAQGLGDIQAGMLGTLGSRVTHRFFGNFAGAGLGSVRLQTTMSAQIGGRFGSRIYNRIVGREVGKAGLRRLD